MKPILSLFASVLLILNSTPAFAVKESHGGNIVICKASQENAYEGIYSLDFIAADRVLGRLWKAVEVANWDQSKLRIRNTLQSKLKFMTKNFDHFVSLIKNNELTKDRVWLPGPDGVEDLDPENQFDNKLFHLLPVNCQFPDDSQRARTVRAINRTTGAEGKVAGTAVRQITYTYSEKILNELEEKRPLQYSFLLIHEWLRDYFDDFESIWIVNYLLHSEEFEKKPAIELMQILTKRGLDVPSDMMAAAELEAAMGLFRAIRDNNIAQVILSLKEGAEADFYIEASDLKEIVPEFSSACSECRDPNWGRKVSPIQLAYYIGHQEIIDLLDKSVSEQEYGKSVIERAQVFAFRGRQRVLVDRILKARPNFQLYEDLGGRCILNEIYKHNDREFFKYLSERMKWSGEKDNWILRHALEVDDIAWLTYLKSEGFQFKKVASKSDNRTTIFFSFKENKDNNWGTALEWEIQGTGTLATAIGMGSYRAAKFLLEEERLDSNATMPAFKTAGTYTGSGFYFQESKTSDYQVTPLFVVETLISWNYPGRSPESIERLNELADALKKAGGRSSRRSE